MKDGSLTNDGLCRFGSYWQILVPKEELARDATCKEALPAFVQGTTGMAWSIQTPAEREATVDKFCRTSCGQAYTSTLAGRRRGCQVPTRKGDICAVVPGGPQEFPADYPGLRLGCVVDDKHGKYCATLKGAPGDAMTAPKDSDGCEFFLTCCYGELAADAEKKGIDPSFFSLVDKRCPGSAKYRSQTCI